MKLNISLVKLFIKILVLMLILTVLFIISAFLYSARYWPDIYNYVNANITIKRIPTISELNLTVIEVEFATDSYTTDIDYSDVTDSYDSTTEGGDSPKAKMRRALLEVSKDYNELPVKGVVIDYFLIDDEKTTKVMKDLIDESKLTARDVKDVEIMIDVQKPKELLRTIATCNGPKDSLTQAVFPWIATIFVRNDSKDSQFEYFCDGALVSDRVVLTAARCLYNGSQTYEHEDFVVILGKTSLQVSGANENILRVKSSSAHPNFTATNGVVTNDLGLLILEEPVTLNAGIDLACLKRDESVEDTGDAVTTAWSLSGDLTLIYFDKEKSKACGSDNKVENTFCATYGNDVALCPSYGGAYVGEAADSSLYLQGIRHGNPRQRGICFSKDVTYTSLKSYSSWIEEQVLINKS